MANLIKNLSWVFTGNVTLKKIILQCSGGTAMTKNKFYFVTLDNYVIILQIFVSGLV